MAKTQISADIWSSCLALISASLNKCMHHLAHMEKMWSHYENKECNQFTEKSHGSLLYSLASHVFVFLVMWDQPKIEQMQHTPQIQQMQHLQKMQQVHHARQFY